MKHPLSSTARAGETERTGLGRADWLAAAALAAILAAALGLRLYGLGWDAGFDWTPHPDERAILSKTVQISFPLDDLGSLLDVPVRQLSLGQRMRCDLAAALLHSPSILFLDEPTIGLDAVSKLAFRDFIRRFNRERGITVILTTHDMDDIEALCDRVMVISSGKILSDGGLDELRRRISNERRLVVELVDESDEISDPDARVTERIGRRVALSFDPESVSAAELIGRVTSAPPVRDLFVEDPPIEEIIAGIYEAEG